MKNKKINKLVLWLFIGLLVYSIITGNSLLFVCFISLVFIIYTVFYFLDFIRIIRKNKNDSYGQPLYKNETVQLHRVVTIDNYKPPIYTEKESKKLPLIRISILLIIFFTVFTFGSRKRTGAVCRDGTYSYSVGSGTCSHHNGVREWRYKYWWD
ncbi:DUF3761 domain-containing protein [Myroides sp. DW712]|uniref:DUF3761 domain-containing protein n=1 Tax=Myroides sp. DW712 TaxID=3389800 RepID=UPI00397BD24A